MAEHKFNTADQYAEHKESLGQCYVKGCTEHQYESDSDTLCEKHMEDSDTFLRECELCNIPVPGIVSFCDYHGGVSYTDNMKERLQDAIKPRDTSFLGQLKEEAKEILPDIALEAFVKATRASLVKLLKSSGIDSDSFNKIVKFIDSDLGSIMYSVLLSGGLSMMPKEFGGVDTEKLSIQLRKHAMKELGSSVLELFLPAMSIVLGELAKAPEENKTSNSSAQLEHIPVATVESMLQTQKEMEPVTVR